MSVAKMAAAAADHQRTRKNQIQAGMMVEISGAKRIAATIISCKVVAILPIKRVAMYTLEVMK